MPTENKNAIIAVVCNGVANFVHLKNQFAAREDLAGYRLFYAGTQRDATRRANIVDFAILYFRPGEPSVMSDHARAGYNVIEKCEVKIRLAFFQIVNYTEK